MRQLPSFDLVTFPTLVGWLSGNGEVDTDRRQQTHSSSSILSLRPSKRNGHRRIKTKLDHYINSTEILSQDNQNRILNVRRVNRDRGTELAHPAVEATQLIWDWAQNRSRCSRWISSRPHHALVIITSIAEGRATFFSMLTSLFPLFRSGFSKGEDEKCTANGKWQLTKQVRPPNPLKNMFPFESHLNRFQWFSYFKRNYIDTDRKLCKRSRNGEKYKPNTKVKNKSEINGCTVRFVFTFVRSDPT